MNWESIGVLSGIIVTAIGTVYHLSHKIGQIELKLDLVWTFIMERGMASMIANGLGTLNSPLVISDEAISWFENIAPQLRAIYKKHPKLTDYQLGLEIQKNFGEILLKDICINHKITNGECLWIAIAVAKSES